MPTVLRIEGYRFFFFSDEHLPKHIHIEKADCYARIEIDTLMVTDSYKCTSREIKKLVEIVKKHRKMLKGAWNEYFKEK